MTQSEKIIRPKVGVLDLAKQLSNVSRACQIMGYSRRSFQRFKDHYDEGGELAHQALSHRQPNLNNLVAPEVEEAAVASAIEQRAFGQQHVANELREAHDRKSPITAADLLNDRVMPFFDTYSILLCRVIMDRGAEYYGNPQRHKYELYLALGDIDHTRTKTRSPQNNGIYERFKTALDECYRVAFREKVYRTHDELQQDLDAWLAEYNERRSHQGRWCYGKLPPQTFHDSISPLRTRDGAGSCLQ